MPETSMNKYGGPVFCKNNVRLAWKMLAMKAKPEAERKQTLPYYHFGFCVFATDTCHHPASHLGRDNISHDQQLPR